MANPTQTGSGASSGTTANITEELSSDVSRLRDTAAGKAEEVADTGKQRAASAAQAASFAIGRTADALKEDDQAPEWLASAFQKAARQIENLAKSVEGQDVADIRHTVTRFARRSPTTFLAASAFAGFAAARFLRAGGEYQSHQQEGLQGTHSRANSDPSFGGHGGSGGSVGTTEEPQLGDTTRNAGTDVFGAAAGSEFDENQVSGQHAQSSAPAPLNTGGVVL